MRPDAKPRDQALPWERNTIRWQPDESTFPLSRLDKTHWSVALAWTLAGLSGLLLPGRALLFTLLRRGIQWEPIALFVPFLAAGLLALGYGISRFYARRLYTLRKEDVDCDDIHWIGRSHFKEPMKRYEGVLKEHKWYAGGKAGKSRLIYRVVLKHSDPKKNLLLYQSYSWRGFDEAWQRFAKLFQIPALEPTPDGLRKLSPRDLEVRRNQRGEDSWTAGQTPKLKRGKVTESAGDFELRYRHFALCLPRLTASAACAMLGWVVYERWGLNAVALPAVPCVGLFFGALNRILAWEVVGLTVNGIEVRRESPMGIRPLHSLPADCITNCGVARAGLLRRKAVVVRAGGEQLVFAAPLAAADKEALKDFFILLLSQGPAQLDLAS